MKIKCCSKCINLKLSYSNDDDTTYCIVHDCEVSHPNDQFCDDKYYMDKKTKNRLDKIDEIGL